VTPAAGHAELVRAIYADWARGNFAAGTEHYDPEVLLVLRPEFPDPGTYLGLDAIAGYMRDFLTDFEGVTIAGEEFVAAGDSVIVRVHQRATGPESRVPVAMRYYQVWTFRGGSVVRIESIRERADALAACGLAGG
jgi:ketosteroid isomerase-like protein